MATLIKPQTTIAFNKKKLHKNKIPPTYFNIILHAISQLHQRAPPFFPFLVIGHDIVDPLQIRQSLFPILVFLKNHKKSPAALPKKSPNTFCKVTPPPTAPPRRIYRIFSNPRKALTTNNP